MAKVWMPVEDGEHTISSSVRSGFGGEYLPATVTINKDQLLIAEGDWGYESMGCNLPDNIRLCRQVEADPLTQQQSNADGLLPCPFCGGEVETEAEGINWYIWCDKCDNSYGQYMSESHAQKRWNRRATVQQKQQKQQNADITIWAVCDDSEYVGVWVDELFTTEADANAYVQREEEKAKKQLFEYDPDREDYGGKYTSLTVYPRTLRATLPDSEATP